MAALVTQGILDFMTDPTFQYLDPTSTLPDLQKTIGVAAVGFWIIFSTVAAPIIIQNVDCLRRSGWQRVAFRRRQQLPVQTAATTAGGAAVASPTGLPLATARRGGHGGPVEHRFPPPAGLGSAGAIIIAGSGLPPRSARGRPGDDITGNKAVRELIAKSKPNYY